MRSESRVILRLILAASTVAACVPLQPPPASADVTVSRIDGARLRYVPAGLFTMGNDEGWPGQRPAHEVDLAAFWIDETEVTNQMYALCVQDGACQPPEGVASYTRERYFIDSQYAEYPVVRVSWNEATEYCQWAGRQLPSEAQWEKAARGTDARLFPWGNQRPDNTLLNNFDVSFAEDTSKVGAYPKGASPYGALDMAGNVWEWTADWFDVYPEGDPQASENFGHVYRVLRGGSFVDAADATSRYHNFPELRNYDVGFRCAISA